MLKKWNEYIFKAIFITSLVFIFYCWWNRDDSEEGTWSEQYDIHHFVDKPSYKLSENIKFDSKGELECRRVMEKFFKCSFPKVRPKFLMNEDSGKCLEIDCYNEELGVGCEFNGRQHYEFVKKWHKDQDGFQKQQYLEDKKHRKIQENGKFVLVVPYWVTHAQIEPYIYDKLIGNGYTPKGMF